MYTIYSFIVFQGAVYIYNTFLRPVLMKHEKEIDRKLMEVWCRGKDFAVQNAQKIAYQGQAKFFDILQFVTTQAASAQAAKPQSASASVDKEKEK